MLAMRGLALSYETVREWCLKLGQTMPTTCDVDLHSDRWHLDKVFLRINVRVHCLSRAGDQDGDVLDILVQSQREKKAAKKFFCKVQNLVFVSERRIQ
jgi:putative transposase